MSKIPHDIRVAAAVIHDMIGVTGRQAGLSDFHIDMALAVRIAHLMPHTRAWSVINGATTMMLPASTPAASRGDGRNIEQMMQAAVIPLQDLFIAMRRITTQRKLSAEDVAFITAMMVNSLPEADRDLCLKIIDDPRAMAFSIVMRSRRKS
jgi:hypothetical protein